MDVLKLSSEEKEKTKNDLEKMKKEKDTESKKFEEVRIVN